MFLHYHDAHCHHGLVGLRDKLKPFSLHCKNACGYKIWQNLDWPSTHKVAWPLSHVTLQDHVSN